MKLLLAASTLTLVMGLSTATQAKTQLSPTPHGYSLSVELSFTFDAAKIAQKDFESFYQGDFQAAHNAQLDGLTEDDLYSGIGSAEVPTTRWVTH